MAINYSVPQIQFAAAQSDDETVNMCNLEVVRGNWMFNRVKCKVDWIISEDHMLFVITLLDSKLLVHAGVSQN